MTIQISDDQSEAMKAALKLAIPKVSLDPHGEALQQLLGLLGEKDLNQLAKAELAMAEADEIRSLIKRK